MTALRTGDHRAGARFTCRAWWSLPAFVPSFALAFAVGEGIASALGYPSGGDEQAPWSVALVAVTPALLVFVLPALSAVHFARKAIRLGDTRARVPMWIALAVSAGFILLNGLSALTWWLA